MTSSAPSMQSDGAKGFRVEVDSAGLDLREVEDVVDDRQQGIAGGADRVGVVALLDGQLGVGHQAAHADDRVHRRADLVAHRRQERALGLVGCLCGDARIAQIAEQLGVVDGDGSVLRKSDEEVEVGRRVWPLVLARAPDGHHAVDATAADERRDHESLHLLGRRSHDLDGARVLVDLVDDFRARLGREAANDPCRLW